MPGIETTFQISAMMKVSCCLKAVVLVFATFLSHAQPVKVGDKAPEYVFTNVYNNHQKGIALAELRGKLVVLDFWNTGCASCIESWPKLMDLQARYALDMTLLLVNPWQDTAKIGSTYRKWEKQHKRKMTLPSVSRDTSLLKLFSVATVPHVVWIDQQGLVTSVTHNDVLNERTVDSFLKYQPRVLTQKIDERYQVDMKRPVFVDGNGPFNATVLRQSIFSMYRERSGRLKFHAIC